MGVNAARQRGKNPDPLKLTDSQEKGVCIHHGASVFYVYTDNKGQRHRRCKTCKKIDIYKRLYGDIASAQDRRRKIEDHQHRNDNKWSIDL